MLNQLPSDGSGSNSPKASQTPPFHLPDSQHSSRIIHDLMKQLSIQSEALSRIASEKIHLQDRLESMARDISRSLASRMKQASENPN